MAMDEKGEKERASHSESHPDLGDSCRDGEHEQCTVKTCKIKGKGKEHSRASHDVRESLRGGGGVDQGAGRKHLTPQGPWEVFTEGEHPSSNGEGRHRSAGTGGGWGTRAGSADSL